MTTRAAAGADVLILIDASQSMRAADVAPDRLSRAKEIAARIAIERPEDRVGLLLFAGDHALACPLTSDRRALLSRLSRVDVSDREGTDISGALDAAVDRFAAAGVQDGIVVLLTDGARNALQPGPRRATTDVRVIGVAIGRPGVAPVPTELGVIDVFVDADEGELRAIAEGSGGVFVPADVAEPVQDVVRALGQLAGVVRTETRVVRRDGANRLASVAATILAGELIFSVVGLRRWQ